MVDAQARAGSKSGAERRPEGLVVVRAQPPGIEGRQAPVLALGVEVVGRGSNGDAGRQQVLPEPGVGAGRVGADGEIGDERDLGRRGLELDLEQPLEPLMETNAVRGGSAELCDLWRVRMPEAFGPGRPRAAAPLGEHAEGGEGLEAVALPFAERLVLRGRLGLLPDPFQRRQLERVDGVAVDMAGRKQFAAGRCQRLELGTQAL
jgi:hypothetical protein